MAVGGWPTFPFSFKLTTLEVPHPLPLLQRVGFHTVRRTLPDSVVSKLISVHVETSVRARL